MKTPLIIAILLSYSTAFAGQAEIDRVETAFNKQNIAQLKQLDQQLEGYDQALARYRLSIVYDLHGDKAQALDALDSSIQLLETITNNNIDDVESLALLANNYGFRISFEPLKAIVYGPKSSRVMSKAFELDTDNPRIHLFRGIANFHKPTVFGGSKIGAHEALTKAIALYADDRDSNAHWGYAEAYVWRGLSSIEMNDKQNAIADWQQALQLSPEYGWPKMLLQQNQ